MYFACKVGMNDLQCMAMRASEQGGLAITGSVVSFSSPCQFLNSVPGVHRTASVPSGRVTSLKSLCLKACCSVSPRKHSSKDVIKNLQVAIVQLLDEMKLLHLILAISSLLRAAACFFPAPRSDVELCTYLE